MEKISVLIVEDHQLIRESWAFSFNTDERFIIVGVADSGVQV